MASLYQRRNQIWIKFGIPGCGRMHRLSLQTSDWGHAELMMRKVELLAELMDPVVAAVMLPDQLGQLLATPGGAESPLAAVPPTVVPVQVEKTVNSIVVPIGIERVLT